MLRSFHRAFLAKYSAHLPHAKNAIPRRCMSRQALALQDEKPLFDKILIANRGEIACRVMRTCKALGIKSVAVYSDIDRHAMHTQMADEAYHIGPSPSAESYLRMDKIIEVARSSGAQAIHPGYGFLSENAEFAEKVVANGLEFIGPPASAIIAMGSKSASKSIMSKAKVPVVPGYHGENQDPAFLKEQADKIGYPVLIKAVKGGGGKGMRIVETADDFQMMLDSSKRESKKSFGDDRVLVEKYLTTPRHVEVQVFADKLGNVVHLFERDCSVQRRHQKIIEEAPAPGLPEEVRLSLGEKAVAAAKAVNYVGAGTVEFIMDNTDNQFYFMEMNTRLQVEHPVTEMVTKTDLVEWQLRVASGNRLPLLQKDIKLYGHAFEARIYAENPRNNFLPDTGLLTHLKTPQPSDSIRVETGVRPDDRVSVFYDPMIAKLVVHGNDRHSALQKLRTALEQYEVVGPSTNIAFLKTLAAHPEFIKGNVETGFIKKYYDELFPKESIPFEALAQLALSQVTAEVSKSNDNAEVYKAWTGVPTAFRLNHSHQRSFKFELPSENKDADPLIADVNVMYKDNSYDISITKGDETEVFENVRSTGSVDRYATSIEVELNSKLFHSTVVPENDSLHLFSMGHHYIVEQESAQLSSVDHDAGQAGARVVVAPMPCKIVQVMIEPGANVKKGSVLVILEAMKMEHVIRAPIDCKVGRINFKPGDLVEEGKIVVVFDDPASENQ